ncbi:MerR family transcriptional regulator [Paenibacillus nasutitermitis]|uniref:HTH-type transcriptional regulator YfmP n=1 Tax=Paenibacillus nasutitermitis TaxID=1652958 RepID=A0A916ZFE6_9BACL|nr:MerR family transcriptional regulator [Paenibacillus nasutitermitis]GGD93138.1 HTH-type transcriptional regulator YfmP [Paenibacillus nasutitermitis]
MKTYKIEDAAAKTGLTKRTIRYYEELGLIETLDRTEGGMRLYSEADIDRLNKIVLAKEVLGFSLQELQQFVKMNERIDHYRHAVQSLEDRAERRRSLLEISEVLEREMDMIELKMKRMDTFKEELHVLNRRVREAIGRYEAEGS